MWASHHQLYALFNQQIIKHSSPMEDLIEYNT